MTTHWSDSYWWSYTYCSLWLNRMNLSKIDKARRPSLSNEPSQFPIVWRSGRTLTFHWTTFNFVALLHRFEKLVQCHFIYFHSDMHQLFSPELPLLRCESRGRCMKSAPTCRFSGLFHSFSLTIPVVAILERGCAVEEKKISWWKMIQSNQVVSWPDVFRCITLLNLTGWHKPRS